VSKGGGGISVRAPITGTLVTANVAPGMFVKEGQEMFHIVDLDRLWLELLVPEANIARVDNPSGAWFTVDGFDDPFEVAGDSVVASGGVLDARTRTIPLVKLAASATEAPAHGHAH